jgi:hypothetical protein
MRVHRGCHFYTSSFNRYYSHRPTSSTHTPGSALLSEPATEFFAYAALMVVVMALFIMLAMRYQYR